MNCSSDFDGIVFDVEHGNFNNETLYSLIQLTIARGKLALVRITTIDNSYIRRILDAGASGIIFSTVESIDQLNDIEKYCLYPPAGGRRGQGLVAENLWGKFEHKLQQVTPILIPQIETTLGIDLLSRLDLDHYPHLHSFLIGPYDLSADLGDVGNMNSEGFLHSIDRFESYVPENKRAIHLVNDIPNQLGKYAGYAVTAMGMDTLAILNNIKALEELV
jgi:2-keto-3-deoxy-L-rhamnonate aldolase RhmA